MAINITSWMNHTVTRKRRTGAGAKGDPTYGSPETKLVYIAKQQTMVRDADGREVLSDFNLACQFEVKLDDVFWFPSLGGETADDTSKIGEGRSPKAVRVATDKRGVAFIWRVYF